MLFTNISLSVAENHKILSDYCNVVKRCSACDKMSELNPNRNILKGRLAINSKPEPDDEIKIESDQGIKNEIKTEIDNKFFNKLNEDQEVADSFMKTESKVKREELPLTSNKTEPLNSRNDTINSFARESAANNSITVSAGVRGTRSKSQRLRKCISPFFMKDNDESKMLSEKKKTYMQF